MDIMIEQRKAIKVFYSYSHKDESFRDELENHLSLLNRLGIISEWHHRKTTAGVGWESQIDDHLNTADLILLLISSDFLASSYCYSQEMKRALAMHEMGETRVIPILLRAVSWEGAPFAHLQMLPKEGRPVRSRHWFDEDEAWLHVVQELRTVINELRPKLSDKVSSHLSQNIFHLPFSRNPFFTGREEIMLQLHTSFASGLTQSIVGLGGIGKTQIAIEYIYRYQQNYHYIFWINAVTAESLQTDLIKVAALLHLPLPNEQIDLSITMKMLEKWLIHNEHWLLLFDNADNLEILKPYQSLLHISQGHVLITTREVATGSLTHLTISIEPMKTEEAMLLLLRRAKILTPETTLDQASPNLKIDAETILKELDGLPLALDQAGAYIEETSCSLSGYSRLYKTRRQELLYHRGSFPPGHPEPIATTWSLSFQLVEQASPAAAELLRFCAFLQPDNIPVEIIANGSSYLGKVLEPIVGNEFALNGAIRELLKFSLVKRSPDGEQLRLHRLVQAILKDNMPQEIQRLWAERVIKALEAAFEDLDISSGKKWQMYILQAQNVSFLSKQYDLLMPEAANVLLTAVNYLKTYAYYVQAEPLCRQALLIRENAQGEEHPDTAAALNNLALLYCTQGRYVEAEPLYKRALHIYKKMLGEEHPDTSTALNNLALLYYKQGKYVDAEPLYKQALHIREKVWGTSHVSTATVLHNMGLLYSNQGKYREAEAFLKQALHISENELGAEHPDTITSLHCLATLYNDQGKYAEAEKFYLHVLEIRQNILGVEHPDTAEALRNLATLYLDQGKYAEAKPLFEQAWLITEATLGREHPSTVISVGNLASVYCAQGMYSEAELLRKQALEIHEKVLGVNHPSTATSLNNLAALYQVQGKYAAAETLYKRVLLAREKVLGSNHPSTAMCLNNLAGLYSIRGKYTEAETLYKQALQVHDMVLGAEHPDTITTLNNLATLYLNRGEYVEAEPLYQRVLHDLEKMLGTEHPGVATVLNNLAWLYFLQRKYTEAETLYKRTLQIQEKVLGVNHSDIATGLNNLAMLYRDQQKYLEAEALCKRALQIHENALGADHPSEAILLNSLALLFTDQKRYLEAEPLFIRALRISENIFGKEHPNTAMNLNNLATLYHAQGKYMEAELFCKQALQISQKILGLKHPTTQLFLSNYTYIKNLSQNIRATLSTLMDISLEKQLFTDKSKKNNH